MDRKPLLYPEKITEEAAIISSSVKYGDAYDYSMELVDKANSRTSFPIRINKVKNDDTGDTFFQNPRGQVEKCTFQIGNNSDPQFNILFITGTHGEESRLWRAGLEALLQLAEDNFPRTALLEKGQITFDLFSDIHGFDNQSRGYSGRNGIQVNAPLITGRSHDRNPYGLGDRNSEQGRNSLEAVSVLSRSNQKHYKEVCGPLTWIGDHHETNENSQYPSNFFRYGGIMIIAHIFLSKEEQHRLNSLKRCITVTDQIRKVISDILPFAPVRYREQLLYNNPSLRKIVKIRNRIRALGERTFEDIHEKALLLFPHVERDFSLAESIWVGGEMFSIPGILLGPEVMAPQGITTESFQQDLMIRMRQTLAAMEAQLQYAGADS